MKSNSLLPKPIVILVYATPAFYFSPQAQYQVAEARSLCFLILRSFHLASIKLALFKQRVRPILGYCPMFFTYYSQSETQAIEGVQRLFTRFLLSKSTEMSYEARCIHFKLDPLWLRRLKLNLAFLHRIVHSQVHTPIFQTLIATTSGYSLRNSPFKLRSEYSRTSVRYRYFLTFYSRIWNKLPSSLRSIDNYHRFIKSLKTYITPSKTEQLFSTQLLPDALYKVGPKYV